MNRFGRSFLVMLLVVIADEAFHRAEGKPVVAGLRCEGRINPLGIDATAPMFSWVVSANHNGLQQTAFQVIVASKRDLLTEGKADLWDSGKVISAQTFGLEYGGKILTSESNAFWRVRIWDEAGHSSTWSNPAKFSMGLLAERDWAAKWIGLWEDHHRGATNGSHEKDEFAAVLLRKAFVVGKPVSRATLSVCGLGYCISEINGRRVGDTELDPGFTAFDRRVLYVTHDVTQQVRKGENVIRLTLGGGWFDLATPDLFGFEKAVWHASPRALVRLKIEFADGTAQVVTSDETWEAGTGPIQFQCVRGGESVDFLRSEQWRPAVLVKDPGGKLQAQAQPPIRRDGEIQAIDLTEPKPGVYQFKLAENTAGWPRLRVHGVSGQKITFRCAEDFDPDGAISRHLNSHTYGRYQTDEFVLADDREHQLEPRFTYHGFQYVRVEGLRQKPRLEDLVAVPVRTALESAGSFQCSDPVLNRIHAMCVRTYLNNLHSIPTDCPQREKAGWMLDGYVASAVGMWNFRSDTIYAKWARDMGDAQAPDGSVPSIVPTPGWWGLLDPWFGGVCETLPWDLYERYGDIRLLREQFSVMKKYVDYLGTRSKDNLLNWELGDWLEVGSDGPANRTPVEITSSMAYFNCARIVGRAASLMGDQATAAEYLALSEKIRSALNRKYFDRTHHRYAADSQSASAISLVLGLVPEEERPAVFAELLRNIAEDRHNHVSTGLVGTRFLFEALHAGGRDDVAYAILTQPDFPGWVNMLNNGATTVWESWQGQFSRDHPALSVVDAWLYQAVAGITPEPDSIAFDRIAIAPQILGGMTWAWAIHDTVRGRIESRWRIEKKHFNLKVVTPVGTHAQVVIPSQDGPQHYECNSGSYTFTSLLK